MTIRSSLRAGAVLGLVLAVAGCGGTSSGNLFGGVRTHVEMRLEVEDSPNAAAMALIAIRCARIARDRGMAGPIGDASAFLFKHPPVQIEDSEGYDRLLAFAEGREG